MTPELILSRKCVYVFFVCFVSPTIFNRPDFIVFFVDSFVLEMIVAYLTLFEYCFFLFNSLKDFKLNGAEIIIEQGFSLNTNELNENDILKKRLSVINQDLQNKNKALDSIANIPQKGNEVFRELKALFPDVISCSFSVTRDYADSTINNENYSLLIVTYKKDKLKNKMSKKMLKNY